MVTFIGGTTREPRDIEIGASLSTVFYNHKEYMKYICCSLDETLISVFLIFEIVLRSLYVNWRQLLTRNSLLGEVIGGSL
jgi:hypothetical protein